jgi:hypothetical protein
VPRRFGAFSPSTNTTTLRCRTASRESSRRSATTHRSRSSTRLGRGEGVQRLPKGVYKKKLFWTQEACLDALASWVEQYGEPPTYSQWSKSTPGFPNSKTVKNNFGSWSAFIVAGGYPVLRSGKKVWWTVPRVIEWMLDFRMREDRWPSQIDFTTRRRPGGPSISVVKKRFGSVPRALRAAGMVKYCHLCGKHMQKYTHTTQKFCSADCRDRGRHVLQ